MGVLISLALGLAFWIAAGSLGWKPFDAFLVTIALVLIAVTVRALTPFVQRVLGRA